MAKSVQGGHEHRSKLADRLALDALDYSIPPVANRVPYFLGALTLTSVVLCGLTGVVLTQFYQPTPLGAHSSVVYIVERAPLGDLTRNLHWWSANAAIVGVLLHLSWVFYRGSYRAPRELTWLAGVGMLACLFLLFFTGTTLPNHQEGYEALAHNVAAARLLGPLGAVLTGGFTPSTPLLSRLYALHVSVLPLALVVLLAVHLYLIRTLGVHTHQGEARQGASFRGHLRRMGAYVAWLTAGLLVLAIVWPHDLGYPAVAGAEVTKPPLPFLWLVSLENQWGVAALAVVLPAVFLALAAIPFVDRSEETRRARAWRVGLLAAAWTGLVALTIFAALSPQVEHVGM